MVWTHPNVNMVSESDLYWKDIWDVNTQFENYWDVNYYYESNVRVPFVLDGSEKTSEM